MVSTVGKPLKCPSHRNKNGRTVDFYVIAIDDFYQRVGPLITWSTEGTPARYVGAEAMHYL
jgi:hypothetical protein